MKSFVAAILVLGVTAVNLERKGDYFASEDGFDGHWAYERVVPKEFDGSTTPADAPWSDDLFMRSMIANYAMEKADKDTDKPTGEFYFNPIAARMASKEILKTHMKLEGKAADDYLDKYFAKTWDHFDTADEGKITSDRMATFFRFLCANMQINLH